MLTEEQEKQIEEARLAYQEACRAYAPIYMGSAAAAEMSAEEIAALVKRYKATEEAYCAALGTKTSEQKAIELSQDKARLKKRLMESKACLKPEYKKHFSGAQFDFKGKRLVGEDGYVLQWTVRDYPELPISYENQQTSAGSVGLEHIVSLWYIGFANTDKGCELTVFQSETAPTEETHGRHYGWCQGGFLTKREVVESVEFWLSGTNGRNVLTNFDITDDHKLVLK